MKTLFTAALAAVLLLFIGWSLFSDSTESADSKRIGEQITEKRMPDLVRRPAEKAKATAAVQTREVKDLSQGTGSSADEESSAVTPYASKKTATSQAQTVQPQPSANGSTQQTDPGDMPNEKFVRDLERYQSISYRNYDDILRLANQQVIRKE